MKPLGHGLLLFILIGLSPSISLAQQFDTVVFKDQKTSLIDWKNQDPQRWLDLSLWKRSSLLKDIEPDWERKIKERRLREKIGKVIRCVGECRIYRGEGFSNSQYRSTLREGDEVVTIGESYLWIFLLDGTLVRMSPDSSITLKELNIGTEANFLHARMNSGNILWLSRQEHKIREAKLRQTDSIFLPLKLLEANPEEKNIQMDEDNLMAFLEEDQRLLAFHHQVNQKIEKNNKLVGKKPTYSYLVMPNGTVYGKQLQMEFVVLLGSVSYIKRRSLMTTQLQIEEDNLSATFYYRGFINKDTFQVKDDQWYLVGEKGRKIEPYFDDRKFLIAEYLTQRIPSIYMARELFLERYSKFIFQSDIVARELATKHGYRLWGAISEQAKEDMWQRVEFLKEYTRRIETTNLLVSSQFRRR